MQTPNNADGPRDPIHDEKLGKPQQEPNQTYPRPNGVYNVATTTFMVLPRIRDQDRQVRVLVENLLNATVVTTLLSAGRCAVPRTVAYPVIIVICIRDP
jgi:hypothetical protein